MPRRGAVATSHLLSAVLVVAILCVCTLAVEAGEGRDAKARAGTILRQAGVSGGLCVHLGCGDGTLTAELSGGGRLLVHGLDRDAASVAKARRLLRARGIYGLVWAERLVGGRLPYAENLVNLIVADDLAKVGVSRDEVLRVLCPNGVAWIGGKLVRKPWPKGMDEWNHPRHGPDGNAASGDSLVAPPRRMRWIAGPMHEASNQVTAGGRFFHAGLIVRDAFNGLRLWESRIDPTPMRLGYPARAVSGSVQPVVSRDYVFAVTRKGVVALDAVLGKPVAAYPELGTPHGLLHDCGMLIATDGVSVKAASVEPGSHGLLWSHAVSAPGSTIAGGDGVFLLAGSARRGETRTVVKLARATGKPQWVRTDYPWATRVRRFSHHDGLLVCEVSTLNNTRPGNGVRVLSAADGALLWQRDYQPGMSHYLQARAIHVAGHVWVLHKNTWEAHDGRTGEVRRKLPAQAAHCFPPVATPRYLLAGEMNFTDIATGRTDANRITKAACGRDAGFMPANGLVYCAPKHCACWPMVQGYVAMAGAKPSAEPDTAPPADVLEAGPAMGKAATANTLAKPDEWPSYRADAWRSGSTAATVPSQLDVLWTAKLGGWPEGRLVKDWLENRFVRGPITPPVAAGGVVVARPDAHEVVALDARTGTPRWRFTANGRVDSPPTLFAGLCLFGTRSGYVYCLRLADGQLVWRRRAGADDERIVSFGQLESPWPVPGSVLVVGGRAYFAAGRHPFADGGVRVFAIEPASGKLLWAKRITTLPMRGFYGGAGLEFDPVDLLVAESARPAASAKPTSASGTTPDFITMSRWRMSPDTGEAAVVWKSGFGYYGTSRAGVVAPRGVWTYGPRMDYIPSGPPPGKPDYVHQNPRPLMVFRGNALFGSSDDKRRLFRKDFSPKQVAAFNDVWYSQRQVPRRKEQKGARSRSARVADGARWTLDAFPTASGGAGIGAVVLAGDTVFVAGQAGRLAAFAVADGKRLAERDLPAPVWDGMAAAYGRIYVSTAQGDLLCLGKR